MKKKNITAVAVNTHRIEVFQMELTKKFKRPLFYRALELGETAEENKIGQIQSLLKSLPAPIGEFRLVIPRHWTTFRRIELATGNLKEVEQMVPWQAMRLSAANPEELSSAYRVISQREGHSEVLLIAANAIRIEQTIDLLTKSGFPAPDRCLVNCQAVAGWFQNARETRRLEEGTIALVQVESGRICLDMIENGFLLFSRVLKESRVSLVIEELTFILEGFHQEYANRKVSRFILLVTPGIAVDQWKLCLSEAFSIPLEIVELSAIETAEDPSEGASADILGAVLVKANDILDLSPRSVKQSRFKKSLKRQLSRTALLLSLWAAVCGGTVMIGYWQNQQYLKELEKRITLLLPKEIAESGWDASLRKYHALPQRKVVQPLMKELITLLPEGVRLTAITWKQGEGVILQGYGNSVELVIGLVEILQSSEFSKGARLDHMRQQNHPAGVEFRLTCGVKT